VIRNQIYAYAFHSLSTSHPLSDLAERDIVFKDPENAPADLFSQLPQLAPLKTCRQVYAETKALPIQIDTIHFIGLEVFKRTILRLKPDERCLMYSVALEVVPNEWFTVPSALNIQGFHSLTSLLPKVTKVHIIELHYGLRQGSFHGAKLRAQKEWLCDWLREGNERMEVTEGNPQDAEKLLRRGRR